MKSSPPDPPLPLAERTGRSPHQVIGRSHAALMRTARPDTEDHNHMTSSPIAPFTELTTRLGRELMTALVTEDDADALAQQVAGIAEQLSRAAAAPHTVSVGIRTPLPTTSRATSHPPRRRAIRSRRP